jgi:hypothetical protein
MAGRALSAFHLGAGARADLGGTARRRPAIFSDHKAMRARMGGQLLRHPAFLLRFGAVSRDEAQEKRVTAGWFELSPFGTAIASILWI